MKVYQVTRKTFYKMETKYGEVDVQLADCGTIPETYSSRKKAERRFYEIAENHKAKNTQIQLFPYEHFTYEVEFSLTTYRTVVCLLEVEVD